MACASVVAPSWAQPNAATLASAVQSVGSASACASWASLEMPAAKVERRRWLRELDAASSRCSDSAPFLALLGALWLEEGEASQAMLWLERAILLDPQALGARADYALALAVLGQTAARDELLAAWAGRDDVPAELMSRLRAAPSPRYRPYQASADNGNGARWRTRGELSLRLGRDNNLDRSPVLDSITLTPQDRPQEELPLAIPLRPRAGSAAVVDLAWRAAHDSGNASLWQLGVAASARHSPEARETDWQSVQLRADHWRAWDAWRGQLQFSVARSSGRLSEPYSVRRFGVAIERDALDCTHRLSVEAEGRRQQTSTYLDGNLLGAILSAQCGLPALRAWRAGLEIRRSTDQPKGADRPGGRQTQTGLTLKLVGSYGQLAAELGASWVRAEDEQGYNQLLENNARRAFQQRQIFAELSYRLPAWQPLPQGSGEAFLQWNSSQQTSNIALFANSGTNAYAGLRWRW